MRDIEHELQCACVRWFRYQYPDKLLIAIPNGGARSSVTGSRLKQEGVVAGAPDLFLFEPNSYWSGLCIEMKTKAGKQSDSQKQFETKVMGLGYLYIVCRDLSQFIDTINAYLRNEL